MNLHTVEDTEFFKEQANLKLRLREMALQVETKRVEHKRQKVAARQPLQPLNGAPTSASKARPPTQAQRPTSSPTVTTAAPPKPDDTALSMPPPVGFANRPTPTATPAEHAGKRPPLEPHCNYHPLSAADEGTIRKQAYANLRVLPVGTAVEADFAPRYFRDIPGMHQNDGIEYLMQHGTGYQRWSIYDVDDICVYLKPISYKFPGAQYATLHVTAPQFMHSHVVIKNLIR